MHASDANSCTHIINIDNKYKINIIKNQKKITYGWNILKYVKMWRVNQYIWFALFLLKGNEKRSKKDLFRKWCLYN